jgi:hypothetical protein
MTQQQDTTKPQPAHQQDAATKPKPPIVFTDENPEYPFLVYNHKTRQTKAAADKKQKEELAKEGFVDEPYPPEDPDSLTQAEIVQLQALLTKAAKELGKLGKLSQLHETADAPAENPKKEPAAKK